MRTTNAMKNASISLIYYFINTFFAFLSKSLLIKYIGIEYSGLNSLLTNVIGMLNIAELGLSSAVGYTLYKPLIENDYKRINEILCLYKYLYRIVASVVFIFGLFITVFINFFVNSTINIGEVRIVFLLYLLATVVSYLLTFLNVLPIADQKNYLVVTIQNNGKIFKNILQIISIAITRNYYVWLIIEILASIVIYAYTNYIIRKKYPLYKKDNSNSFRDLIKKYHDIVKKAKNLFFHKIGGLFVYQTDNILISYFGTLTDVGIYTNYILIYNLLTGVVDQAFMGITASIGNYIIEKENKDTYCVWKEMYIIIVFITTIFCFLFYKLATPFVSVVFGKEYILSNIIVLGIAFNIMFKIVKAPIDKFKEAYGIFWDTKAPVIEAIINFVFSVILGKQIGILGVVLGTIISNIFITIIWKPYVLFKYGFKKNYIEYYKVNIPYILIAIVAIILSNILISIVNISQEIDIIGLIKMFIIYGIISVLIITICFCLDKDFRTTICKYFEVIKNVVEKKLKKN